MLSMLDWVAHIELPSLVQNHNTVVSYLPSSRKRFTYVLPYHGRSLLGTGFVLLIEISRHLFPPGNMRWGFTRSILDRRVLGKCLHALSASVSSILT